MGLIIMSALSIIMVMLPVQYIPNHDCSESQVYVIDSKPVQLRSAHSGVLSKPPKFSLNLCETLDLTFTADSGASVSIVDNHTFDRYLKDKVVLEHTSQNIKPYGNGHLKPKGRFTCVIQSKSKKFTETFYVFPGNNGCLLSVRASQQLGLLKIADHTVNNVSSVSDKLVRENPMLFKGIGAHNKVVVKLHVDESVMPVAQRHRRIPFHMRQKVKTEIQRLLDLDIIERVDGPTRWVSPIVIVSKPHNPEEVRTCVDMRCVNRAVKRSRFVQPTLDDIQSKLNGSVLYSKLDLKSGYHQLVLNEGSRYLTTFSIHIGLFNYKRLNFGISSASELFQNVIAQVFDGIYGVMNISDDIIVSGKSQAEHDNYLKKVFASLSKYVLTLNKSKCEFNKNKIEFYGMIYQQTV